MAPEHFPYLWAAYRRGCFATITMFPGGLGRDAFVDRLEQALRALIYNGGDTYILIAPTAAGEIPVGIVTADRQQLPQSRRQVWPYAIWFPEATKRNKLECWIVVLMELHKEGLIMILCEETYWTFFRHVCDYGLLRPVGKIRGFWADGRDAMQFQGS